jgi:hypothetical protein
VDAAEAFLRSLGFRQFRVRHHDRLARLELSLEEMPRLWEEGRREAIVARLRELGYTYVAVDLAGFQSGSANFVLGGGLRPPSDAPGSSEARSSLPPRGEALGGRSPRSEGEG